MSVVIHAALDPHDRLLSDDPRLTDLHQRLGGAVGGPISLPPISALGRVARRLGRVVTRPVTLSAPNADIGLWVRAQPEEDSIRLTLFDWSEEPLDGPSIAEMPVVERPVEKLGGDPGHSSLSGAAWSWRVDSEFRLLDVVGPAPLPDHGSALTQWLLLEVDEDGLLPLLVGLAGRRAFERQPVRLIKGDGAKLMLSGEPLLAGERLVGYRGILGSPMAEPVFPEAQPVSEAAPSPPGLALDNALRRPLGRIIANAETISGQLEGPLRRDYATYAADIAAAGRHLMALVDDLADLRAIERPNFTVIREMVDLADAARRAGGLLGVKAADRRIRLDLPAKDESLAATAEFRRVLQILVNLIGNAIRYSPEGSQIWVRAENGGDMVSITVADQGRGVALEDQERIFEKFERLGRREAGGSGLGLYISRRLARAMGGDIAIDSAPGQGARFTLTLPAWKAGA